MDLDLKNKVAIVTGASRGIGYSICQQLLLERARVVAFFRGDHSRFDSMFEWMKEQGLQADFFHPISVDIADVKDMENGVNEVMSLYGKVDVLVNCAGLTVELPFLVNEEDTWAEIFDINVIAVFRLTKLVVRHMMRAKSGNVINISSIAGSTLGRGVVAYASSKAAIIRFSAALALEVGKKGVRINSVSPGIIDTQMATTLMTIHKDIVDTVPLQRIGLPEEVAKAVLFLASEKTASFITGHDLIIDGGMSI